MPKPLEGLLLVVALAMVLSTLPGCATAPGAPAALPLCAELEVTFVDPPSGRMFVFDADNMRALLDRSHNIQEGRCRLPSREAPSVPRGAGI
jgi:curli biogenesis system outer membrane secretion channel CsgG